MLFVSLFCILAGISLVTAAGIMTTFAVIGAGEKDLRLILSPGKCPPAVKKWAKCGGLGLASTLLGMILAVIAT